MVWIGNVPDKQIAVKQTECANRFRRSLLTGVITDELP